MPEPKPAAEPCHGPGFGLALRGGSAPLPGRRAVDARRAFLRVQGGPSGVKVVVDVHPPGVGLPPAGNIPAQTGNQGGAGPRRGRTVQGDIDAVGVDHRHQDQAPARERPAEFPAVQAGVLRDPPAEVLTQTQKHQGGQPFLAVKGRRH